MAFPTDSQIWVTLASEHQDWLSQFDPQYLRNWKKQFNSDSESAMAEAAIRRRLQRWGMTVEPNEALTGKCGGPDFRCTHSRGHFYVEVTCIRVPTAEKRFGNGANPSGFSPFNLWGMVDAVFNECQSKARQCGGLDGPALVAVCTFDFQSAVTGLKRILVEGSLTGKTSLAWDIDPVKDGEIGDAYQVTAFESSAFLKLDSSTKILFARNSISGLLIGKLGCLPDQYLGVLHPNPVRPFNPLILPSVEFASLKIHEDAGRVEVTWTGGCED